MYSDKELKKLENYVKTLLECGRDSFDLVFDILINQKTDKGMIRERVYHFGKDCKIISSEEVTRESIIVKKAHGLTEVTKYFVELGIDNSILSRQTAIHFLSKFMSEGIINSQYVKNGSECLKQVYVISS